MTWREDHGVENVGVENMPLGTWVDVRGPKDIGARSPPHFGFAANISTPFSLKSARQTPPRDNDRKPRHACAYWVLVGGGCGLGQID